MEKSKFLRTVLFALVIVGGIWALVNRDQIKEPGDVLPLLQQNIASVFPADPNAPLMPPGSTNDPYATSAPPVLNPSSATIGSPGQLVSANKIAGAPVGGVIRIAVFKLNQNAPFLPSAEPARLVAEICRQYDVVALQNISRNDTTWIRRITDQMNQLGATGLQYQRANHRGKRSDYVAISDRSQRTGNTQTVILFNRQTVQLDQARWYLVKDPDDVFQNDPMVAWFRAGGVPAEQAFTFSLACLQIDPIKPANELNQIGALMRAIRNDGRGEDDVILVGDFQSDDRGLDAIRNQAGLSWVVSNQFTNVRRDRQFDNIVFSENPTNEFTGRGGVVDFIQQYRLQPADAVALADRLPIWAEFSILENGPAANGQRIPGRIANAADQSTIKSK